MCDVLFVCLFPTILSGSNKKIMYFEPNFFFISAHFRCKIYFYLEDDSIQVIEPKVENSGIPQGMNDINTVVCVIYRSIINILYLENISGANGAFCEGAYRFSIQWQYGYDSAHQDCEWHTFYEGVSGTCSSRKIFEIEVIAQ